MNVWAIIVILILAITVGVFVFLTYRLESENTKKRQATKFTPFSGFYGKDLKRRTDGENMIQCPVGSKVNIVGAIFEVYDPYMECSAKGAVSAFNNTCKATPGSPTTVGSNNDITTPPGSKTARMCSNLTLLSDGTDPVYVNSFCSPHGAKSLGCAPNDATYYLGQKCNGKQSCDITVNTSNFGPLPCANVTEADVASGSAGYNQLPWITGNPGTANNPNFSDPSTSVPATNNSGFYAHGIYSCVPDDES